ncbi:phage major capsid protein [Salinivibrio socompensis]|uniref:phage major capsid protein n=1 Tax=Salinivibrio socompensis TaxID=1510206 RepID=UPI0004715D42|nr:phage major capsid protein [Salinivibrio socompensis]
MAKLAELKRARAEKATRIQAIADQEANLADGESLSAEQLAEFDQIASEIEDLDSKIERQEKAQLAASKAAKPVNTPYVKRAVQQEASEPGDKFAQYVMAVAHSGGDLSRAAEFAESNFGDEHMAAAIDSQSPDSGGVLVHQDYASDLVELLKPRTVVRRMGARSIPMPNGNLTMPRKTGRGQATYGKEGDDIKITKPTFGDIKFSAKKLTALTPISNDLIRQSSRSAIQLVREDLIDAISLAEDSAFLRSDGSNDSPVGILNQTNKSHIIPASEAPVAKTKPELDAVDSFLNSLIKKQRLADAPMITCGWVLSPSVFTFLEGLRDGNGNKVYPELSNGRLKGFTAMFTNQIPENLSAEGNESEIYFTDFSQVLIADTMQYRIAISSEASYVGDDGKLTSAFSRDQTLMRIIAEHDLGLRHDQASAVATGVKWGID